MELREGLALLRNDDDEYTTLVQQQVNRRRVLLFWGAFFCACVVLGSFVMMHPVIVMDLYLPLRLPPTFRLLLPLAAVEPNDFDATTVQDGTTLADLNVVTAHAFKEIQAGCESTSCCIPCSKPTLRLGYLDSSIISQSVQYKSYNKETLKAETLVLLLE